MGEDFYLKSLLFYLLYMLYNKMLALSRGEC